MSTIQDLTEEAKEFRDQRGWKKYHTPKDLAISISLEASELLELFQWKDDSLENVERDHLSEEMADIFIYLLFLSDVTDINLEKAVRDKLEKNKKKYPSDEDHFD
ncbi:MAG: nucleotide pyrophosphohydrolase [Candidatus Natronoplasma sp.]